MNCEILETLYVKSNGEIPCNDDAGERVLLGRIDAESASWTIRDIFCNEHFDRIRRSFPADQVPWPGVCENCAFFRSGEAYTDKIRQNILRKLQVETSLACNLSCPCCVNALQVRSRSKPHIMQLRVFEKLIRSIRLEGFTLGEIEYCGQGEPLMNPQFSDFVALAREQLPETRQRLITNGNFDYSKTVKNQFIDEIFVSCDGVFQDGYAQYRVRGQVHKPLTFMQNVPSHVNGRKQLLVWKYILFEFNDSDEELIAAQDRANDLGVDILMFVFTHSNFRSTRYTPELAFNLPIRYSNVTTNLTPIIFNRRYSPATKLQERKSWLKNDRQCRITIDEVAVFERKTLTLRGWALAHSDIRSLHISFDGEQLGHARIGLPRPDVLQVFPEFQNAQSGFALAAPITSLQAGAHTVQIEALLTSGKKIKRTFSAFIDAK
jgi:hypothetical protein